MADLNNELNVPAAPSLTLDAAPAAPTLTLDPAADDGRTLFSISLLSGL